MVEHAYPSGRWRQGDQGEKEEKKEKKERGKEGLWAGVRAGAEEALKCTIEVWSDGSVVKSAWCSLRTDLWFPASMQGSIQPPVVSAPEDTTPSSGLLWHCNRLSSASAP